VRAQQLASARTNEYFVPKEGIDREVITADICRYLGNDALVRPGNYENPQTRQIQQGYFVTAYRNLTTAMIADLKADSERWEAERRQTASRGQPSGVEYRASTTHQSRQYYGPTESAGAGAYAATSAPNPVYDTGTQYQQQSYPQQSSTGYAAAQSYAPADNNYYVAGADLRADLRAPTQPAAGAQPRTVQYSSQTSAGYQGDNRAYYPQPGSTVAASQYSTQQPSDPFYGRAAPPGNYDSTPEIYDTNSAYTQGPVTSSSTTTTSTARRDREREPERDNRGHHRRR
jgi:hypothetical protein